MKAPLKSLSERLDGLERLLADLQQQVASLTVRVPEPTAPREEDPAGFTLTTDQIAARLQIGRATWYRMVAGGKAPAKLKMAGTARWSRVEIDAWVQAGTPPRLAWEQQKKARR